MVDPVVKNVILASADQVAVDAVAARLMGFDPMGIRYLRLAHERGLGVGDPRSIRLVGDDLGAERWGFRVRYNSHSFLAWLAWYGPTRVLQNAVLRSPLVVVPTLIAEIEQDYLYWPLRCRAVADRWRRETEWGRLFQRYQDQGALAQPTGRTEAGVPA
jgi:hypothetical protein